MCSSQNFPKIFQFVKGLSLVEQKVVEKLLFFQIKHVGPWRKKAKKVKEFLNFYLFFFFSSKVQFMWSLLRIYPRDSRYVTTYFKIPFNFGPFFVGKIFFMNLYLLYIVSVSTLAKNGLYCTYLVKVVHDLTEEFKVIDMYLYNSWMYMFNQPL